MAGKLIWITSISGCGENEHLFSFQAHCRKQKVKLKIYSVGSRIFSWAREKLGIDLNRRTILNVEKNFLDALRTAVLNEIQPNLQKDLKENDAVLISDTHTTFYWRGAYNPIYNERFIMNLNPSPDMFVCFINRAEEILAELSKRNQWEGQGLTEKDIWLWQNNEVDNTRRYLYLFPSDKNKKFFVIPVKQPPETLYHLLFEPWKPIIYIQMPITHLKTKDLEKVKWFIEQLWKHAVVFSPLTIETGAVEKGIGEEVKVRHNQTAYRDLEWFIPQCDISLAYYVKVVFSAGVPDETVQTSQRGKEAWVIFPGDHSPFIQYRAMPNRIFGTPEEALEFLEKIYIPQVRKKFGTERESEVQPQAVKGEKNA